MKRAAINGLGRNGRATLKILIDRDDYHVVAVNDNIPVPHLVKLLQFDSETGRYDKEVKAYNDSLIIDGKKIKVLQEDNRQYLPWEDLDIDIVFESSPHATNNTLRDHLEAGAKDVVLSTPVAKKKRIPLKHKLKWYMAML